MARFRGRLVPISHGGHYVEVPAATAVSAGVAHGARVRGTVNGVAFRSALMKYSGVLHLGVPKAARTAIGAATGDLVEIELERDDAPLPGDALPKELARALRASELAKAGFDAMAPSHRREHVKHVLEAKRPETRDRRIAAAIEAFEAKARSLTTARPPRTRR